MSFYSDNSKRSFHSNFDEKKFLWVAFSLHGRTCEIKSQLASKFNFNVNFVTVDDDDDDVEVVDVVEVIDVDDVVDDVVDVTPSSLINISAIKRYLARDLLNVRVESVIKNHFGRNKIVLIHILFSPSQT